MATTVSCTSRATVRPSAHGAAAAASRASLCIPGASIWVPTETSTCLIPGIAACRWSPGEPPRLELADFVRAQLGAVAVSAARRADLADVAPLAGGPLSRAPLDGDRHTYAGRPAAAPRTGW